jgi:hypothetical protein
MPVLQAKHVSTYDPTIIPHRKAYAKFLETNSWKHTELRFDVEHPYVDVPTTLANKTLQYYMKGDASL